MISEVADGIPAVNFTVGCPAGCRNDINIMIHFCLKLIHEPVLIWICM